MLPSFGTKSMDICYVDSYSAASSEETLWMKNLRPPIHNMTSHFF